MSPEPHLMTTAAMLAVSRHQTSRWRMAHYDHPKIPSRINRASPSRRSAPTATHPIGASPIRPAHQTGEIPGRVVGAFASIQTLDQPHVLRGADRGHAGTATLQKLDRRAPSPRRARQRRPPRVHRPGPRPRPARGREPSRDPGCRHRRPRQHPGSRSSTGSWASTSTAEPVTAACTSVS